ncbi:hypothetical protein [Sphingomonas sp. URHD0057]|uniref:hypothetical protein n=1 Tax=Sphingomonas sp. URHD0057 TaxID=1380389 RepID=UPI000AA2F11B|nr:hypothetical protein [Sphingomonas sp. URHD0057]
MRKQISSLLFIVAGLLVSLEVFVGLSLMQGGRPLAEQAQHLVRFAGLSIAALALATAVCPDHRLLSLGRALVLGAALGIVVSLPAYAAVPDRAQLTWQLGLMNVLVVGGIGALIFVRAGGVFPGRRRAPSRTE